MLIKKLRKFIRLSWKNLIVAIFCGMNMAFSIYLVFLQPNNVISKMRLAITAVIWMLITLGILAVLYFDVIKLSKIKFRVLFLASVISIIISSVFLSITFNLQELPYNLLLLPKRNLEVSFLCSDDKDQTVELKYFYNGLSIISYSALEKEGEWIRTKDSLRTTDCNATSLLYYGWLVEQPKIVFRTQPNSGQLEIKWNGVSQTADLNSPEFGEMEFSQDFGFEPNNKISVFITFSLAIATIIFPLIIIVVKDLLHEE